MSIHWRQLPTWGKIEAVRSVWYSGISAREIAAHFNGATRNAIIGLYDRYPDDLANAPLNKPKGSTGAEARAKTGRNFIVRKPSARKPATPAPVVEQAGEYHVCGRPLMMMAKGRCKWPVNDAEVGETHLFCCIPANGPYCGAHAARGRV
jgi:hypothetical protein